MNKVRGRIVIKESGAGIPDLLIVIYDCDPKAIPKELFGSAPMELSADIWQKLRADRLGSVLSNQDGGFELEYEDEQFRVRNDENRPNLLLFVVGSEDSSTDNTPKVLYVSAVRQNAGRIETYLVRLSAMQYRQAGISMTGLALSQAEVLANTNLIAKMKKIAVERQKQEEEQDMRPFSVRHRERQAKFAQEQKKAGITTKPPLSFELSVPIHSSKGPQALARATIALGKQKDSFIYKRDADVAPIELTFKGIEYAKREKASAKGQRFLVDEENKSFILQLPSSPSHLELSESRPSELYQFYTERRSLQNKAEANGHEPTVPATGTKDLLPDN